MKWRDLCLLREQEQNAIQILKYVTLRNLLGDTIYIHNIELSPMAGEKWFFMQDSYGEYHFVASRWEVVPGADRDELLCHHEDFHRIVYFLSGVYEGLQDPRWSSLRQMVYQLRNEYPIYCSHCKRRSSQLSQVPPSCHAFIHSPLVSIENATVYINRHCVYMDMLLRQTKQEQVIYRIVKDIFSEIKSSYAESLFHGDAAEVAVLFRRNMINRFHEQKLSFLSFQGIDFNDWLLCLMYIEESQCESEDQTNFRQMIHKLWILLNLYFTERPNIQGVKVLIYPAEEIELNEEDMDMMLSTHPLLRGTLLTP